MYNLSIAHHRKFYDYLKLKHIPNDTGVFKFLSLEHFIDVTASFLSNYAITQEIDKIYKDELITIEEKNNICSFVDSEFIKEIEYFISNTLLQVLKGRTDFSINHFQSFFMIDIQKQIQSILFETLISVTNKNQEIALGEEKTDVLYMIIEANGSVVLERKDCSVINSYSYHQQEHSVAEILYLNPSLLIVYDALQLLKPEMTICLKKTLRKKVVFLDKEHPLRKNRTQ